MRACRKRVTAFSPPWSPPAPRTALPIGVLLMVLLVPSSKVQAGRPPPLVRLTYERQSTAADCPDKAAVMDAVRARLGFDPFREPAEVIMRATVERRGEELNATLRMSSSQDQPLGERHLVSNRAACAELASAMDLAISIAIDPLTVAGPAPAPVQIAAPPAPAAPPAVAPPPPAPAIPVFIEAELGAAGNTGGSLSPTLGFFAGAALGRQSWSVLVEGRADLPTSRAVAGGQIDVSVLAGTLAPCLRRGRFGVCVLGTFGQLRGSGRDLDAAQAVTTTYVALGGRVQADALRAGAFALRAQLDLVSPLSRTTLKVGGQPVWTTPSVSVSLGLAGVVTFR